MSNGKYGMKLQVPAQTMGQQLPWNTNDPWYNLGGLLGTMWADNYNQRGTNKTIDEMQRVYNNMMQNQSNSVSNMPLPENLSNGDTIMGQNLQVPDNIAKQYDTARAIGTAKVAPDNKAVASTASTATSGAAGVQAPQRDVAAEKWDVLADKYVNAGTDNPDGDKRIISTMTDAVKNGLATYDLSKLPMTDINQMKALLVAEARKNGRTDYQIQRALESVMPDLQSKVNEAKDNKWGQLRNILDQQIQSGQLDNAMVTYAEMGKLQPEKTAALKNKVDRMWEPFNLDRKFDLQKDYYKRKFGFTDREAQNMIETGNTLYSKRQADALGLTTRNGVLGSYGGKGSGRSGGKGSSGTSKGDLDSLGWGLTASEQKELNLVTTYIDKYLKDETHGGISDDQYNNLLERRNILMSKLGGPAPQTVWAMMDNWLNSGMTYDEMRVAINNTAGLSDNQRSAMLNRIDDMQDSENRGHTGTGEAIPTVNSERKNPDSSGVFAGWGASEKTGVAKSAADSGGIGSFNIGDAISDWWSRRGFGGSDWK